MKFWKYWFLVLVAITGLAIGCDTAQAQGSYGSHGYGLFRDGDGYLLPWGGDRIAARHSRQAARASARAAAHAGYGSAGSSGYGSAGSSGYGSAGSTSYSLPAASDLPAAVSDDAAVNKELTSMYRRLVSINAEQERIYTRLKEIKAERLPDKTTSLIPSHEDVMSAARREFAMAASTYLKPRESISLDQASPQNGTYLAVLSQ